MIVNTLNSANFRLQQTSDRPTLLGRESRRLRSWQKMKKRDRLGVLASRLTSQSQILHAAKPISSEVVDDWMTEFPNTTKAIVLQKSTCEV